MRNPEDYCYDIDTAEVLELWRRGGAVVGRRAGYWILLRMYFGAIQSLSNFDGGVSDNAGGGWTVHAAVDLGVPTPVISTRCLLF